MPTESTGKLRQAVLERKYYLISFLIEKGVLGADSKPGDYPYKDLEDMYIKEKCRIGREKGWREDAARFQLRK